MKTLARVIEDEPEPPRRLRPEVPVELEAICLKCLAKKTPVLAMTPPGNWPKSSTASGADCRSSLTHPPGILARVGRWARVVNPDSPRD